MSSLLLSALLACLVSSVAFSAQEAEAQEYRRLRPALFGLAIEEKGHAESWRLVRVQQGEEGPERVTVLVEGTLETCERVLLADLHERYGKGNWNMPFATMGGGQYWGDELIFCGWRIQENVFTGHFRLLDPQDTRQAWGSFEVCRVELEQRRIRQGLAPRSDHLVVLLHGLFRTKNSFSKLERALEAAGFDVESVNYPSTRRTIEEHAAQVSRILARVVGYEKVSFVTHSLGGIVARQVLADRAAWNDDLELGRLVQLAPPNRGSVVAETMRDWLVFEWATGESGQQLTPDAVASIPVPDCPFGVIAGGKGDGRGFNVLLEGDDDGTVTVASTRLGSEADFMVVDALHSFVMSNEAAIAATVRFLVEGRFRAAD